MDEINIPGYYEEQRRQREVSSNQYISVNSVSNVECKVEESALALLEEEGPKKIDPVMVNGYDGFSGVHSNIFWQPGRGYMYYTLHNKFIRERT